MTRCDSFKPVQMQRSDQLIHTQQVKAMFSFLKRPVEPTFEEFLKTEMDEFHVEFDASLFNTPEYHALASAQGKSDEDYAADCLNFLRRKP